MKHNIARKLLSLSLVIGILGTIGSGIAVAAQNNLNDIPRTSSAATDEKIELKCAFPLLRDISGQTFDYSIELIYSGSAPKRFNLSVTAPPKWIANVLRDTQDVEAPAIELSPNVSIPASVRVRLASPTGEYPNPGDYKMTFKASSGDISQSIELTATVTALYRFAFYTESERLDAKVTAGQNNQVSLILFNTGTAPIQKITFTSEKPSGWNVEFSPTEITSLEAGATKRVNLIIGPPDKTIAGDYMIKVSAIPADPLPNSVMNMSAGHEIDLRVTVLAPTIWGWVGIIVVVGVIGGVVVIFRRLGRR